MNESVFNLLTCLSDSYQDIQTYLETRGMLLTRMTQDKTKYKAMLSHLYQEAMLDACIISTSSIHPDPFELVEYIQTTNKYLPIILIVERQEDVLRGYAQGVDYCTCRPVDPEIFSCYIIALLRRVKAPRLQVSGAYKLGTLIFSAKECKLIGSYETRKLSSKESEILRLLCSQRGNYVPRDFVLTTIWGEVSYRNARILDVNIARLRKYLEKEPVTIIRDNSRGIILQDLDAEAEEALARQLRTE